MTAFPQYARTTDPAVLDVLAQNRELDKEFLARGMAFAEAHGGTGFYSSRWGGTTSIVAIAADKKPTSGQWKKHPRGGWAPYKNNPLHAEFSRIECLQKSVPGLPEYVESAYNDQMQHYMANPRPFVLDDAVYVGFSFVPQDRNSKHDPKPEDGGWEEIRASKYVLAMETFNDRIKAEKSA